MRPFEPSPFRPSAWLPGAHAQTVAGKLLRPHPDVPLRRERWDTPDGDFLDVDFAFEGDVADDAPVALVLHGLEGSARRPYVLLTYRALARHGVRPVGLNFRGCSGEPNRTPRFYHSGETDDAALVLRRLRDRFPASAFGGIGFSLGGNVLLKLVGEGDGRAHGLLDAAVGVSVPFDLSAGSRGLESGLMNRLYTYYFMRSLRRKAAAKRQHIADACDVDAVLAAPTLRAFDDAATAPLHGFEDAEDYYGRSSSNRLLEHIRIPTLLLHSLDDPFLPPHALPRDVAESNPCIVTAFTEGGGHVGFIEGPPWSPRFWAEEEAARFLAAQLGGGEG